MGMKVCVPVFEIGQVETCLSRSAAVIRNLKTGRLLRRHISDLHKIVDKNDWRFNTSFELSHDAYQKEKHGLDLSKLSDIATFNRRLRAEELNNQDDERYNPNEGANEGANDSPCENDSPRTNEDAKSNPETQKSVDSPGYNIRSRDMMNRSSSGDTRQTNKKDASPTATRATSQKSDIVEPRRSARLAEKRSLLSINADLEKIVELQRRIVHVAKRGSNRGMNESRRPEASPRQQRRSGSATQRAARRNDHDRDDRRRGDAKGVGERTRSDKRGRNESSGLRR